MLTSDGVHRLWYRPGRLSTGVRSTTGDQTLFNNVVLGSLMCAGVPAPASLAAHKSLVRDISRASARFALAFAKGDYTTLAALLTDASVVMSAGVTATGRPEILTLHRSLLERRPGITLVTEAESIEMGPAGWNVASERAVWIGRWIEDEEQVDLRGSY